MLVPEVSRRPLAFQKDMRAIYHRIHATNRISIQRQNVNSKIEN